MEPKFRITYLNLVSLSALIYLLILYYLVILDQDVSMVKNVLQDNVIAA